MRSHMFYGRVRTAGSSLVVTIPRAIVKNLEGESGQKLLGKEVRVEVSL